MPHPLQPAGVTAGSARWFQLALGVLCMAAAANLQYGWALFVGPLDAHLRLGRAEIQFAFTLCVLTAALLMPLAGYAADRCGTRAVVMSGGALIALAWSVNAYADSLAMLYAGAVIGGIGVCAVYSACIGHALKWFVEARGFAVGIIAAGFGTVSAATVLPIHAVIESTGYARAFLYFGLGQGAVVMLAAVFLARPAQSGDCAGSPAACATLEVLRAPAFWLMYVAFFLAALAGVMAIAQLGPLAKEFEVAAAPVSLLNLALPALAFALAIDRIFSGLSKVFFGRVSDRLGREEALCIALVGEAVAITALGALGRDPSWFVLLTGVIFFGWGQIYAVFPAMCADTFGTARAATHAGMLYTAKGLATLTILALGDYLLPIADWKPVFYGAAALNALAALLAIVFLKPMRVRVARARAR